MEKAKFGMIGLGVMGRNFLLNVAENGFRCVGYDLDGEKVAALNEEGREFDVRGVGTLEEFVDSLERPRKIMLLVPAGKIVDAVINDLKPHLEAGDLIIDGGNSHFPDTERREKELSAEGFEFLGVGVSGGAEGARRGPSIMIGGRPEAYRHVQPVLEAVSAKVGGEPCAAHVGKGSAGHFVKMVHNGIEYGLMQLICETYDLLKRGLGMDQIEMSDVFAEWDAGELNSFLIEITAAILPKKDDETDNFLVEMILDTAGQKGTGRWTSEVALEMGVPIPTIDSAVTMRQLSAIKAVRRSAAAIFREGDPAIGDLPLETLKKALYAAFVITYAQGLSLLSEASTEKGYDLHLEEIARIWRGGCIIRAALLENIRAAFSRNAGLSNLLFDEDFVRILKDNIGGLRSVVEASARGGFPSYCLMSCLAYFDAYRSERLPANLLQAQRDFFGSHTYQRVDRDGIFHTEWEG
ncbi:MAG: NADP-dependent phosphogluconate dehydrogenase [Pyrinomonadaceae bacterium]